MTIVRENGPSSFRHRMCHEHSPSPPPPSGGKKARRGPKVVFRRIGADGGRRRGGRTNTKVTMAPSLYVYTRIGNGELAMLCKWKYRSEKMLAKKLSPDFLPCATRIQKVRICSRCCLCLRTASSVGQNSPGSNRASGPRFQRTAAASSIWPQPPLISPPRPQRSGGCEARKLEERVEVAADPAGKRHLTWKSNYGNTF